MQKTSRWAPMHRNGVANQGNKVLYCYVRAALEVDSILRLFSVISKMPGRFGMLLGVYIGQRH